LGLEGEYAGGDPAWFVGWGAITARNAPVSETEMSTCYVVGRKDTDLDPWSMDAGLAASIALSGGATWENQGSVARRRQFWSKYMEDAKQIGWTTEPEGPA
jgi:Immunity protein Imm5